MMRFRLPCAAVPAVMLAAVLGVARPMPGDPTEGRSALEESVRSLAELNLRPDFELSAEQKGKIKDARDDYAVALSSWRVGHVDDFQRLADRADVLRDRPPGAGLAEAWTKLSEDRRALLGSAPDAGPSVERIRAVLTDGQRRRFDAAIGRVPAHDAGRPDDRFGAEVQPLPPDGIPKSPGFYKVKWAGNVTTATASRRIRMTYVVFLPKSYRPDGGPYPTLVFMHGSGEAGSDGNGLFAGDLGPAADLRRRPGSAFVNDFPMVLICPQCPPRGERWDQEPTLRAALGVLDDAQRKLRIDPDRIYLTGLSMGGKGTWLLAGLDPDRFAALCPISSSTLDPSIARRMRYASVWCINGSEDIEDGADHQRRMIAAARDAGGDAQLTILDGRGHDVWDDYYSDPNFYQWFLKHRRPTAAERADRDAAAARLAATRPASGPATRP